MNAAYKGGSKGGNSANINATEYEEKLMDADWPQGGGWHLRVNGCKYCLRRGIACKLKESMGLQNAGTKKHKPTSGR